MSESNNVKFVENKGKWMWKRYDEQGSVIFKSPEFDTEREAREDYEVNGAKEQASSSESNAPQGEQTGASSPDSASEASAKGPESDASAGTATGEQASS